MEFVAWSLYEPCCLENIPWKLILNASMTGFQ